MPNGTEKRKSPRDHAGTMSAHWITCDLPERSGGTSLAWVVPDLRTARGPDATPKEVTRGVDTTADAGHAPPN